MIKKCLACNSEVFNDHFPLNVFFSRYRRVIGSNSCWKVCVNCGSLAREYSVTPKNIYSPNVYYINKEYSKRKGGLDNIISHLSKNSVVFDIGSGPGIISNLLTQRGVNVVQVEPYRASLYKEIPQLNVSVDDFFKLKLWKSYLNDDQKAVFIFIDVFEHLNESLKELIGFIDNSVEGIYFETGCVDFCYPAKNRWYYLDYIDHVFVPSKLGMKFLLGNELQVKRISNSLHSYGLFNNLLRNSLKAINNISYALFKRDIILLPEKGLNDHISAYLNFGGKVGKS